MSTCACRVCGVASMTCRGACVMRASNRRRLASLDIDAKTTARRPRNPLSPDATDATRMNLQTPRRTMSMSCICETSVAGPSRAPFQDASCSLFRACWMPRSSSMKSSKSSSSKRPSFSLLALERRLRSRRQKIVDGVALLLLGLLLLEVVLDELEVG